MARVWGQCLAEVAALIRQKEKNGVLTMAHVYFLQVTGMPEVKDVKAMFGGDILSLKFDLSRLRQDLHCNILRARLVLVVEGDNVE